MLMLSLDDACKVLKRLNCIKDGWEDDPDNLPTDYDPEFPWTYIRQELMQKCYSVPHDLEENEAYAMIDEATDARSIGHHLAEGDLYRWLEDARNNLSANLRILLDEAKEQK